MLPGAFPDEAIPGIDFTDKFLFQPLWLVSEWYFA